VKVRAPHAPVNVPFREVAPVVRNVLVALVTDQPPTEKLGAAESV
jgi:hypothetical protein